MSDDAAFIAAIQASPQEEMLRLVYADWLEEQGCAEQAVYLRVVEALATLPEEAPERKKLVKRLLAVVPKTDEVWREQVARRFDVTIEGWLGGAMFVFLKAVHWLTGGQHPDSPLQPQDETHTVTIRSSLRREEAETYLNEIDRLRFRKDRATRTVYRIVPAPAPARLGGP